MTDPTVLERLARGNEKGKAVKRAEKNANRSKVTKTLNEMERTAISKTNIEICRQANLGDDWLNSGLHNDLRDRANALRLELQDRNAEAVMARESELEHQLISENNQLHAQIALLERTQAALQASLADARATTLTQRDTTVDLTTQQILQCHNQELQERIEHLEEQQQAAETQSNGYQLQLRREERDHEATRTALGTARRTIKRLENDPEGLGDHA